MALSVQVLAGQRFGSWLALTDQRKLSCARDPFVLVRCKCGKEKEVNAYTLRKGTSTQCASCSRTRHGQTKSRTRSPEFIVWDNMIQRCYNPNNCNYSRYGLKGVTVCDSWNPHKGGSFENFIKDMGHKPSPSHQLDKEAIDPKSTIYSPETTRWATRVDNNRRKRTSHFISFNGEHLTLTEWAERLGIARSSLANRLCRGWSIERALTTPSTRKPSRK